MKLWTFKKSGTLRPCTSEDKEKIGKMPVGEPFMISYVKVRNPYHHRKYFAFVRKVYDNLPERFDANWPDPESFRRACQMYAGYFVETVSLKGERILMPKSIKFEELDETEFSELHSKVKNFIGQHILPDIDPDIVEKEIEPFYG